MALAATEGMAAPTPAAAMKSPEPEGALSPRNQHVGSFGGPLPAFAKRSGMAALGLDEGRSTLTLHRNNEG